MILSQAQRDIHTKGYYEKLACLLDQICDELDPGSLCLTNNALATQLLGRYGKEASCAVLLAKYIKLCRNGGQDA